MCRAKFGEQAFLDIYQKLYEAPDPAPMLSLGLVSRLPSMLRMYSAPQIRGTCMAGNAALGLCLHQGNARYLALLSPWKAIRPSRQVTVRK